MAAGRDSTGGSRSAAQPLRMFWRTFARTAFNILSFNQNRIEGTIHLDQDAVVVFQMPFDAGWRALANGTRVPLLKVNAGLLGIALKAGEHDLKLQFVPRFLYAGAVVTALSALIIGFGLWRWPRIQLPVS